MGMVGRVGHRLHRRLPLRLQLRRETGAAVVHEPELALVRDLLGPGDVLVDVGANRGAYVAVGVLAGARVLAIEPLPPLADGLRRRFGGRRGIDVEVVASAVGPTAGDLLLHIPVMDDGRRLDTRASLRAEANVGFALDSVLVPVEPLDGIAAAHHLLGPDADLGGALVVKIDVEGAETDVLDSARELLSTTHPTILVEVERRHHATDAFAAFAMLTELGHRGWFIDGDRRLVPLERFDPDRHQPIGVAKDPGSDSRPEGFVNNFLFVHPGSPTRLDRLAARGWEIVDR